MRSQDSDSRGGLSRRTCLGVLGAASVTPFLTSEAGASNYENVVDIVEAGADNSGEEPIDDVFQEHANDDTLIKFPAGRYRVNHLGLYDLTHFAMAGDDATLFPGNNYEKDWISGMADREVRIENFTLDITEDGVAPQLDVNADDDLVVRNIHMKGHQDDNGVAFGFHTNTESGTALVENVRAPDGGDCVGLYIQSEGPVTVRNCNFSGFTNNGVYASAGKGPVKVEGGTFWNNNVAQVRLGSPGSYVRGAQMGVDTQVPAGQDTVNMRGVRVSDGPGLVTVEDCDIQMTGGEGSGAIVGAFNGGSFDVRNTRIFVGEDYTTIGSDGGRTSFGIFVDTSTSGESGQRTFENVSITGGGSFRSAILIRRDDNTVRDCCLQQSGQGRNGITLENSSNNTITETTIDVSDEEIRYHDSSARTSKISHEGSCPRPGYGTADTSDTNVTGEVGSLDIYQSGPDEWHTVGLANTYDNTVLVAGPLSYNGIQPAHLRVRDATANGFEARVEEWMYLNGTHKSERADYLVMDAGTYSTDGVGIEAGHVSADHWFRSIDFGQNFDSRPVVFTQPLTFEGPNPIVTRLRNVSKSGADVQLQEEEGEPHGGAHRTETVGYVAAEPGTGTLYGRRFEVNCCNHVDDDWQRIEFDRSYDDPQFLAAIQTHSGPNTANLRYRNLDSSGVELFVEEEQSDDDETYHLKERVGVFVIEGS